MALVLWGEIQGPFTLLAAGASTYFIAVFRHHLPENFRNPVASVAAIFVAVVSLLGLVGTDVAPVFDQEPQSGRPINTGPAIDTGEAPLVPVPERVQGSNRFATAAAVARNWDPGVQQIYVASGEEYLDSLPAAALAASNGMPLLLSRQADLPSETAAALKFLEPTEVVIVGGELAISAEAESQLRAAAKSSDIRRVAGTNRYATAALLAEEHVRVETVYVVTDARFPDAVASAAQAGSSPGPILLASPRGVPDATLKTIERLRPSNVLLVGGREALPDEVETELRAISPQFTRVSGADRYETAALLSARSKERSTPVIVTSGAIFTDALSAAPLASKIGAKVLLTTPELLPEATIAEVKRIKPQRLIILGSPAAVSSDVELSLSHLLR